MYRRILACVLLSVASFMAHSQNFGSFVGNIDTRWLEDDRRMQLLADFSYVDGSGLVWAAPKGSIVDGASIPRLAWSVIGGPFEGAYRPASVIHDVACDQQSRRWEDVHLAFYNAMRASKVDELLAKVMYAAVYHFGPRWPLEVHEVVPLADVSHRQRALSKKMRGEAGTILEIVTRDHEILGQGASGKLESLPSGMKEIIVHSDAPVSGLRSEDFERLKQRILRDNPSIDEIQQAGR